MANIKDYEDKDFFYIKKGIITWRGYFYCSDEWHWLEYHDFETTIHDFIYKYNRSSIEAYNDMVYGCKYDDWVDEDNVRDDDDWQRYFESWMDGATPIKAADINENTPDGYYVMEGVK